MWKRGAKSICQSPSRLNEDLPFPLKIRKQKSPDQYPNATPTLLLPSPALRFVGSALLDGYVRAGKRDVAVKLAAELLADARQQLPSDHPLLAGTLASVGLSLLTVEAFAEAEPLLRESLTIREKSQPDAWTTFNTQSMLGGALLGLQKYAEAEPLLLAGYDGMIRQKDSIPEPGNSRIPEALDRLIEFYNATDKPDDVEKWQTERSARRP